MGNMNQIQALLSLLTLILTLLSSLMNMFEKFLPRFITRSFGYGKLLKRDHQTFMKKAEIPKSWFKHLYVYASVLTIVILVLTIAVYEFNLNVPQSVVNILNAVGGDDREARVNSASVLLALALFTMQCCRRFYESHYVSVFSKNSRMNLIHYTIGYLHYTCAVLAIIIEAPKFDGKALYRSTLICWSDITYVQIAAAILFVWSWWHQHKVTVILANLRKNDKGSVVTDQHKLPHGDWFNYVSSPHNLSEMLMYTALAVILWNNITWLYVLVWVICNQVELALLSHWWYQATFPDLPKDRKAIIPFMY